MRLIIPTPIRTLNIDLEDIVSLYSTRDVTITLEKFSIEDKKDYFGLSNFTPDPKNPEGFSHTIANNSAWGELSLLHFRNLLTGQYKIVISIREKDFQYIEKMQDYQYKISNLFLILMGFDLGTSRVIDGNFGLNGKISFLGDNRRLLKHETVVTKDVCDKLKKLISIVLKSDVPKLDLLYALLEAACEKHNKIELRMALLVSLLEAIFVPDSNSGEIRYKFSLRITKQNKKDEVFLKRIKKIYDSRCNFYHSGKNTFNQEDYSFIEELSVNSLYQYLINPQLFIENELDKALIIT